MPFVNRDGARIYWRSDGRPDRPALVLGNSLGTDTALWDALVPTLAKRFRVIRSDMRGHGASDSPPGDYTIEALARDVLAVADAAGATRFAYMGISIGGMIGQWLGANAGERIERLVLANTSSKLDPTIWADRIAKVTNEGTAAIADAILARWFTPAFHARNDERVATARSTLSSADRAGYCGCCAAIRDMDLGATAARIGVPTLVVTGAHDTSTPKSHGEALAAAIPGARLVELPYAHIPVVEAPSAFAGAVMPFLTGAAVETERERYDSGLARRKEVLGAAYVEARMKQVDAFNAEFQALITRYAWGEMWTRAALSDRERRMLVLAMTVALGRYEEFQLHMRAGLAAETSVEDVREVLLLAAIYCGVPAANTGFHKAAEILAERARQS